jgi:NADPH:quinone reductase-like Zn-dependent oxidoreductase
MSAAGAAAYGAAMMKAVVLEEFRSAPALRSVERPLPGPGEVVVRVAASGVNPLDIKIMAGAAAHARVRPLLVLGLDLAGTVTEVGAGVRGCNAGDEVYGLTEGSATGPAASPSTRPWTPACWRSSRRGCRWPRRGNQGFDVIFDTVGGAALDNSFAAARTYTGHVVSILGWGTHSLAPLSFRGATYSGVFSLLPLLTGNGRAHHGQILRAVAALVDDGKITPVVDSQPYDLTTVAEAHRAVAERTAQGKVVVRVASRCATRSTARW